MVRLPGQRDPHQTAGSQEEPEREARPLLAKAEVVVGNAIAPFGVIALGWPAFTVVSLYVLDGWLCILGLGASVMIQNRDELRSMVPKGYGRLRRLLFLAVCVAAVEAILSMFAVVPGLMVLAHMESHPGAALGDAFAETGALVSVAILVTSHAMRTARAARGAGEGVATLDPKSQFALYAARMALMMALAWLAEPGFLSRFLVPVYIAGLAALFTYSDLYPLRFLRRLTRREGDGSDSGARGGDASAGPAGRTPE